MAVFLAGYMIVQAVSDDRQTITGYMYCSTATWQCQHLLLYMKRRIIVITDSAVTTVAAAAAP